MCVCIAVKSAAVVRFISNWSSKRKAVNGKSHTATKRAQHVAPASAAAAAATRLLLLLLCILLLPLACIRATLCSVFFVLLAQGLLRSAFSGSRVSAFSFQLRLAKVINLSLWVLFGFA